MEKDASLLSEVALGSVPILLGASSGAAIGNIAGRALTPTPEGSLWGVLPPTMGQVDLAKQRSASLGTLIGGALGGGAGLAAPLVWRYLTKMRGVPIP